MTTETESLSALRPRGISRLILVRHGEVPGIEPPSFRGTQDLRLTDKGKSQAEAAAQYLSSAPNVRKIVSSSLSRAVETARAIAAFHGGVVTPSERLRDIDYGEWQGRTHADIARAFPEAYAAWMDRPDLARIPGGETLEGVSRRAVAAVGEAMAEARSGTIVVVTHDSIIRVLILAILGLPLRDYWTFNSDPCGVSIFATRHVQWTVERINEAGHTHLRVPVI